MAFVVTGQQLGYIEPCGCTGLENQKGGLARRHTFLKELASERGWPVVALDVGSQVKRFGKQQEVKFAHAVLGLRTMGYKAITLGEGDLRLQTVQVLQNVKAALEAANATFSDVVKMNTYVVNLKPEDLPIIREVRSTYLPSSDFPASTLVGVTALAMPGLLIEVEVIAVVE